MNNQPGTSSEVYWWWTDHSAGPKSTVVQQDPGLFREPDSCLFLLNPGPCSYRCEDVVHDCAAHSHEHDDPVEDKEDVVPAQGEAASSFIEVGNTEKFQGMVAGSWKGDMGKEEDREYINGNAC